MKFVVLYLLIPLVCGAPPPTSKRLLHDVINGVETVLRFFSQDYSDINVDGLFGLRVGQGQLIEAIKDCKRNPGCTEDVLDTIVSLEKSLSGVCDKAEPYVESADMDYFHRFKDTVDKPYLLPYNPVTLDNADTQVGTDSSYDEERGDACYNRLMGTHKENDKLIPKCNVTTDCWNFMSSSGKSNYAITHQLLYFIVIENVGCTQSVEIFNKGKKIWDVQKGFCSKIYREAAAFVKNGQVDPRNRDLFLEQTVLCGSLGFEDFMKEEWIKMVLQWPDRKDGCFKMSFRHQPSRAALQLIQAMRSQSTMRKLLREKGMKDNCLSHTTGLGFGTFATYLRYLVRYM